MRPAHACRITASPSLFERLGGESEAWKSSARTGITTYETLLNSPRSAIVDRSMHLRDLTTRIAGLMEEIRDLDDLVIQFDGTEAGRRFISAWKQSRNIIDAGHGPADPPTPPTP